MEFDLSPDQELFREATHEFLANEMPIAKVREVAESGSPVDRDWWRQVARLGWFSSLVPPAGGGASVSGEGVRDLVIVAEEIGRLVSPGPVLVTNLVAHALSTAANRSDYAGAVMDLVSGAKMATWALYEPDCGCDLAKTALRAEAEGGGYVLNGVKDRVESGDEVDHMLVVAQSEGRLIQLLVPSSALGVTTVRQESLDLTRPFSKVRFVDVWLPGSAFVQAAAGDQITAIEEQMRIATVFSCAEMVGAADRVLEFTVEWAQDRFSFGRPLASYQALKHRFADMRTWLEAMRATTGAAVRAVQDQRADAAELASVAKAYVSQRATDIVQDCVQMHGGIGVTFEHDVHFYLRRVTLDRVLWGTPAEHRRHVADLIGVPS